MRNKQVMLLTAVVLAILSRSTAAQMTGRAAANAVRTTPTTAIGAVNNPAPLPATSMPLVTPALFSPALVGPNQAVPVPNLPAEIKPAKGSPITVITDAQASTEEKGSALDNLFEKSVRANGTDDSVGAAAEVAASVDAPASIRLHSAPLTAAPARQQVHRKAAKRHGGVVHHDDLLNKEWSAGGVALIGLAAALSQPLSLPLAMLLAIPTVMPSAYYGGGILGTRLGRKLGAPRKGKIAGHIAGSIAGAAGIVALMMMAPEFVVAHILLVAGAISGSIIYGIMHHRRAKRRS